MASYGGNNRQQSFSFPLLSSEEILLCMNELQIPLDAADLEKPNARSIRPVYETLCEICTGTNKDEFTQPAEVPMLESLQYPELHEDSIPQITFYRAVCKLMEASGVQDTKLLDLVKPDPKRLRRNLSAVINFAKFREERLSKFMGLASQTDELLDEHARISDETDQIQKKIEQLEHSRRKELPQVEKLQAECREYENQINEYNKEQAILKYEANQLKARNNELRDEIASAQFQTLNTKQEAERVQGNIVQSPGRLKGELERQHANCEMEKEENARLEKTLRDNAARLEALTIIEKDVLQTVSLIEEVEKQMVKCREATTEAKSKAQSIETHSATMQELEAQKQELLKQVDITKDKMKRLNSQKQIKSEASKHALKSAEEELDALREVKLELEKELGENRSEIAELEKKISLQKIQHDRAMAERKNAYAILKENVDTYNTALHNELKRVQLASKVGLIS